MLQESPKLGLKFLAPCGDGSLSRLIPANMTHRGSKNEAHQTGSEAETQVPIPAPFVVLGKWLNFSKPQRPCVYNGTTTLQGYCEQV